MTISAKYPGRCRACGGAIAAGERIEWAQGAGARHVHCQGAGATAPAANAAPAHSGNGITPEQASIIRRARKEWFDLFDGASGYDIMHGPSDAQIAAMTRREASDLVAAIFGAR